MRVLVALQTRLTALDLIGYAAGDERPRQFVHMPEHELEQELIPIKVCKSHLHTRRITSSSSKLNPFSLQPSFWWHSWRRQLPCPGSPSASHVAVWHWFAPLVAAGQILQSAA